MPPIDQARLRHMLDAAEEAMNLATGRSRSELDSDRMLLLALIKCIEIIGEAASRVSQQTRQQHGQIPWQDIIHMRNRLIHVYFSVNRDIVWQTIHQDLPPLVEDLKQIV